MLTTRPVVEAPRGFYRRPMMTIGMLYFTTGALRWLDGPLTVFVKLASRRDAVRTLLIAVVFYIPYSIPALAQAVLLKRIGTERGMAAGLGVMPIGALIFSQLSGMHSYPGVPGIHGSLLAIGVGLSLMQAASNTYISVPGPMGVAAAGICNKAGESLRRTRSARIARTPDCTPFIFSDEVRAGANDQGS